MAFISLSSAKTEIKANPLRFYTYLLSRPDGSPFYVGMGCGKRIAFHEKCARAGLRSRKYSVIRRILRAGLAVGYELSFFETRIAALDEERRLIGFHGRADVGCGPLANRTNGGDGGAQRFDDATRLKMSLAGKGRSKSAQHRANISAGLKGRRLSQEHIAKFAAAKTGSVHSAEARQKMSRASKRAWDNAERVAARRESFRKRWEDPEYRARMLAVNSGRKKSAVTKAKIGGAHKALWADPEYREMMKSRRWPDKASTSSSR